MERYVMALGERGGVCFTLISSHPLLKPPLTTYFFYTYLELHFDLVSAIRLQISGIVVFRQVLKVNPTEKNKIYSPFSLKTLPTICFWV